MDNSKFFLIKADYSQWWFLKLLIIVSNYVHHGYFHADNSSQDITAQLTKIDDVLNAIKWAAKENDPESSNL